MPNCNLSKSLFHGTIRKNLLPSDVFLLKSPQPFFFSCCLLFHFWFSYLLCPFMKNSSLLFLTKTFKMVWFHSMRCKHWLFSSWIFSHKIVCQCKLNLASSLILLILMVILIPIPLLKGHLVVSFFIFYYQISPYLSVVILCLFQ